MKTLHKYQLCLHISCCGTVCGAVFHHWQGQRKGERQQERVRSGLGFLFIKCRFISALEIYVAIIKVGVLVINY